MIPILPYHLHAPFSPLSSILCWMLASLPCKHSVYWLRLIGYEAWLSYLTRLWPALLAQPLRFQCRPLLPCRRTTLHLRPFHRPGSSQLRRWGCIIGLLHLHSTLHNMQLLLLVASLLDWQEHSTPQARCLALCRCNSCCSPTLHLTLQSILSISLLCIRFRALLTYHCTLHPRTGMPALTL